MAKKVLVVLSGHGYWGEELIGPLEALDAAGYETEFVTPKGTKPQAQPPSMDEKYVDPPLGRPVTTKEMADKIKKVKKVEKSDRITGRSTADSFTTGRKLIDVLENGLRRYGW
jgi:putative intracellular protease/amidase